MTKEYKLNPESIHELIRAAENRHGYRLCIDDFDLLTAALIDFLNNSIEKFVAGAKEHFESSGSILDINHTQEIQKEIIDLWMYSKAQQKKTICQK